MLERLAFLLDDGARVSALLNPSELRLRRRAGLRTLTDRPGAIAGAGGSDDVLLATAGGRTEIELDLLFDVELLPPLPSSPDVAAANRDVRTLTAPLWVLAENRRRSAATVAQRGHSASSPHGPMSCHLVWGKHLSVRVVVEAVAERLERFDADGVPQRSYLSMRLVRIDEAPESDQQRPTISSEQISAAQITPRAPVVDVPGSTFHEVLGSPNDEHRTAGERLDQIASRYYGDPALWRVLAAINDVDDPPWVPAGRIIVVPPIELFAVPSVSDADDAVPAEGGFGGASSPIDDVPVVDPSTVAIGDVA